MKQNIYKIIALLMFLSLIQGCAQPSVDEKESSRQALDNMAELTVSELSKDNSTLNKEIEASLGYMVINWKTTKVPLVGAGGGDGVVIDNATKQRIYVKVQRFDLGGGWGVRSFKNLTLFTDKTLFEKIKKGTFKFESGAEVAAGKASAAADSSGFDSKYKTYVLLDGGGSATATIRVIHLSLNKKLN